MCRRRPSNYFFDFINDTTTGRYIFYIDSETILHLRPTSTTISNTLHLANELVLDTANKMSLNQSVEAGFFFDIVNSYDTDPIMRLRCTTGGVSSIICEIETLK